MSRIQRIHRILCPVDFSDFSRRALAHASVLSRWYGAELVVLHVAIPPGAPLQEFPPYLTPVPLEPHHRERLEWHLRLFTEQELGGVAPRILVSEGEVVREILACARALPADLVVVGTHGHGRLSRFALGSVAEKLLREAPCPVLTIPAPPDGIVEPRAPLFQTIVCPVDFSRSSLEALNHAFSLAREADAALTIVHVVESLPEEDPRELAHYNVPEYRRMLEEESRRKLEALVPEGTIRRPELVVVAGKAYRQILRIAAERNAGVIVLGVHGRAPLDVFLSGSTASELARRASCPVLTVRADVAPQEKVEQEETTAAVSLRF